MKLNLLSICDYTLAILVIAFCWGVGEAWLAVPAAGLSLLALRSRSDRRESESEREEGLRRVRAQFQKDLHDPAGIAPASIWFDPK